MRHLVLTLGLTAAILIAGAMVPDRGSEARFGTPFVASADTRA
jgi:hypothetical protein